VFRLAKDEVEAQARRAAGWLCEQGLREGERVAVVAGNHPSFVPLSWGALRAGIVPVLVNAHLGPQERARILADSKASVVVDEERWPDLTDVRPLDLAPVPLARPMHYTSGTTGVAKGVWSGVLGTEDAAALAIDEAELWDPRPGETYLVCSPLYHSAPHRITIAALAAGAEVLVFESFDVAGVARAFEQEDVAGAFLVPTHLRRLLAAGMRTPVARRILHAGEPCPPELKRKAVEAFGAENLWEFYGSTEGQFTLCSSAEWLERPGTVGRARSGRRLRVESGDGAGIGTVFVSAPSFARWEYWGDPEKTARAWSGESFTVGDVGLLDADGFLYLEGRREDLIISGGVNVYPAEVERVLESHPGVLESAVFGVDDPDWGQRVCAAVVGSVDPKTLSAWARDRLPGSHSPKTVVVLEALPRTPSGKVKRTDLAQLPSD
jgi:long-chain acyl-CoA synthetase